jgi:protein phosphatase 2C
MLADRNHTNFVRSVFQLQCVPLYGSYAVCGKTPATEDATANVPNVALFMKIPTQMSVAYHIIKHVNPNLFGVSDGHTGCEVLLFCSMIMTYLYSIVKDYFY